MATSTVHLSACLAVCLAAHLVHPLLCPSQPELLALLSICPMAHEYTPAYLSPVNNPCGQGDSFLSNQSAVVIHHRVQERFE